MCESETVEYESVKTFFLQPWWWFWQASIWFLTITWKPDFVRCLWFSQRPCACPPVDNKNKKKGEYHEVLEIPESVLGWGQKWAQLGRCWPGIVADLCCTSSRLGWSDPSRLQHHSFTGFSQYVCLLGSLLLGNKLIFDDGWKHTWSRDSIIGPPVVPVAQDTEKRDLKWTRVELFLYQRLPG